MIIRFFWAFFLASCLAFPLLSTAKEESLYLEHQYKSYEAAKQSSPRFSFELTSTKMGLFSSTVTGLALNFSAKASYDASKKVLKDMQVSLPVDQLSTDNEDRDEKMKNYCLSMRAPDAAEIQILAPGPYDLTNPPELVDAQMRVRGKFHPLKLKFKVEEKGEALEVTGKADLGFAQLEIPDPSVLVASMHDEIKVQFNFSMERKK